MPSSSGPNNVNDSIVFNYDTGDVANSYKGEPTTNLASGLGLIGMSGISLSYIGLEDGWLKYSMSGTFTGGGYPYIMYLNPVSFTGGQYYSTQAIVKTNVPYKFNYFGSSGVSYVNEPKNAEGTLTQTTLPDGSSYVTRFGFAYTNTTSQPGYLFTNPINNTTFNASTDFVYLKNFQVEQKDHCTQYTPSSRSATQGLLDISGNGNSIDITNASFTSNAQMTFDGINDLVTVPNSSTLQFSNASFTVETIIKINSISSKQRIVSRGSSGWSQGWHIAARPTQWEFECSDGISTPGNSFLINTVTTTGTNYITWAITPNSAKLYINGIQHGGTQTITEGSAFATPTTTMGIGAFESGGEYFNGNIYIVKMYNRELTLSEIIKNYNQYRTRFNLPDTTYYNEGTRADLYTGFWNNSTTFTMADFGGIPNVTAHGFSSGPVTYTLTLPNLLTHTKVRYKVYWHLVDSLDNETNQLFLMNSSGAETEFLRFTKVWNSDPSISILQSGASATWSGAKTYTYTPWTTATGLPVINGYYTFDSGWFDHTASTFTARHVKGADQSQTDEAEYLSHVEVQLL